VRGAIEFVIGVAGQTLLAFFIVGAALGAVVGVTLLLDSARVLRWNERLSRWISTREATQGLDRPRDIKRFVYRGIASSAFCLSAARSIAWTC